MKKLVILFLCTTFLLGGCGYGLDVDKQSFVVAVGVDKGEVFPLRITFVFANPSSSSGGENSEQKDSSSKSSDIITVEAPTIFSATRKLDAIKSKTINLSHTKVVVFSEEIAKDGIKNFLTGFASSRDFRPNTYVCITKGNSQKYLSSVKPSQESNIEKYYDKIMRKVASDKVNEAYLYYLYFNVMEKFSGSLVPLVGVSKNELSDPTVEISPEDDDLSYEARAGELLRDAKNPAEILGGAIFKNDKMLGTLGSFETDLVRIICDEYYPKNYSIHYPEFDGFVTVRLIQQTSPSVKTNIKNGSANIQISVPVSIEYVDAGDIESNKEKSDKFCKFLAKALSREAKELINKAQKEFGADILGLGESLKRHFLDEKDWESFKWEEKYPTAQIKVEFKVLYADFEEAN